MFSNGPASLWRRNNYGQIRRPVARLRSLIIAGLLASSLASFAEAHDRGELHSFHCLHGCPRGTPDTDDIVVREIYTLASNDITKVADWVAYRVTPDSIGPSGNRKWEADSWLSPDETLEPSDFDEAP